MQINILDAKLRFSELLRTVEAGEDVVIARRGRPIVLMSALGASVLSRPGSRDAVLALLREPRDPADQRSSAEIEADVAEMRTAWD